MAAAEVRPSAVVARAGDYLARHDVESPRENAETLLMSVLGVDRAALYARSDGLSTAEARAFGRALCQRCTGTPLQHLTGEQVFRHLTLTVRPGVFVPRPETEVLVDRALEMLDATGAKEPVVVDLGAGTGAIAVSIASERPASRVFATDLSPEAVALARENADRAGTRVDVREGDLFEPLPSESAGSIDLVVSNPPYVEEADADELSTEVLADPSLALFGGTAVHERIAEATSEWLRPGGGLVMEIGATQADDVAAILQTSGFIGVVVSKDLAGLDRVVAGRRGDG